MPFTSKINDEFTTFIEFGCFIQFHSILIIFYKTTLKKVTKVSKMWDEKTQKRQKGQTKVTKM